MGARWPSTCGLHVIQLHRDPTVADIKCRSGGTGRRLGGYPRANGEISAAPRGMFRARMVSCLDAKVAGKLAYGRRNFLGLIGVVSRDCVSRSLWCWRALNPANVYPRD